MTSVLACGDEMCGAGESVMVPDAGRARAASYVDVTPPQW
jgi:hypothetical protein